MVKRVPHTATIQLFIEFSVENGSFDDSLVFVNLVKEVNDCSPKGLSLNNEVT